MPSQMIEGHLLYSGDFYISLADLYRLGLRDRPKPREQDAKIMRIKPLAICTLPRFPGVAR